MAAPPIKIRVGASVDVSAMRAFETIERRALKMQQTLARGSSQSGAAQARAAAAGAEQQARAQDMVARRGRKAADEWAKSLAQIGKVAEREMMRQARAIDRSQRAAGTNFAQRVSHRATRFLMPNAPLGSMASNAARDIQRGLGLDFSLGGGLQRNRDLEQTAVDLSNAGFMRREKGPAGQRQDPGAIVKEARAAGSAAALDPMTAVSGLQEFVGKTGDLAVGRAILKDTAELTKVTGGNLQEMLAAAGDAASVFDGIAGSQEEVEQRSKKILEVLRGWAGQGKLGAVEIKHLATQAAKLSASATAVSGDPVSNLLTMGAIAQTSRQKGGAATANIAATSVASLVNTLRTPARRKAFEANGVQLEAGGGMFRNLQDVILDSIKAAGNDTGKFKSMWANVQGARGVEGFRMAFLKAGGGAEGEAAVKKRFEEFGAGASLDKGEIKDSLARALDTTSSKAQIFQNRLDEITEKAATKLIPALEKAGPGLLKFAEAMGNITTWVVENPKKAIAGAISLSIARAGLESAMRTGIEALILGSSGERAKGAGKLAGALGAIGTIGSLAVTTFIVGTAIIDHLFNKSDQEDNNRRRIDADNFNKEQGIRKIAQTDPEKASSQLEQIIASREKNLADTKDAQSGFMHWLGRTVGGLVDSDAVGTKDAAEKRTVESQERELAASRALLGAILNSISGGLTIRNLPPTPGGDLPVPREEQ